jgi:L-serine kinase (ATP) / ParB family transcriptional regulator, heme-responsive regulator
MALVPSLRVAPIAGVVRHEEVDPLRVQALVDRISADLIQVNPIICVETDRRFVVLDGATRTEAFRQLGLEHVVIQVVDPDSVSLETWHHVIRDCPPSEVLAAVAGPELISLDRSGGDPPRVTTSDGASVAVAGTGLSPNSTLSALVDCYLGRWTVSRIIDPSVEVVAQRFPDWSAVVEFPALTVEAVMKAALGDDLLPAGITRFLVPERVLRINVDLELLQEPMTIEQKQGALESLILTRSREGRVRRYEESVIILDD